MLPNELYHQIVHKASFLCVGLDPDFSLLPHHLQALPPADAILAFNLAMIEATQDVAVAYKPNLAFYEALGADGHKVLEQTLLAIPESCFVIADAKRGDIGNTARYYARAIWDLPGTDAITVAPYMGKDSVTPFMETEGKWTFLLALTSNPGSADFQQLNTPHVPLYVEVIRKAIEWSKDFPGPLGFVAGATHPDVLASLRNLAPDHYFLVPGVGAQGGDLHAVCNALAPKMLINVGRQILYASSGTDFAEAAGIQARLLQSEMQKYLA
jgi:orotidine-5'-phosphate decarboxylase